MAPVVTLEAPVLQVHEVDAHGTVGYGATYPVRPGARIATVPVGYADGYLRAAGGRAWRASPARPVPLAGRVSMDLITLDVSALPPDAVRPGTMALLIGGPDGLDELAAAAGTIGYEVLTRLGTRFARRYIGRRTWQPDRRNAAHEPARRHRPPVPGVPGRDRRSDAVRAARHRAWRERPFYPRMIVRQMVDIGYYSLPVVGLTAIFTGMVLALQSHTGFSRFKAESAVATIVVLSMTRELGPVLAGLMVAGRVGASMAAEIGTMRVTEQIDALTTLSTDPFKYLVWPRLLAGLLMLPLLVLVADIIGVFGGYIVGIYKLGFSPYDYLNRTFEFLETQDVVSGLVKAAVFGFLVALMGCYQATTRSGGAQGVGAATTKAVVSASILILTANYVVTELFFSR